MRLFAVLCLTACSGGTPVTDLASSQPAPGIPAGTEAAGTDTPSAAATDDAAAAVMAAGACAQSELSEGQLPTIERTVVGDDEYWVVTCERFAYQNTFEIWRAQGPAAVPMGEGTLAGLGLPTIDADTRQVSWFSKAAGAGQCGDYFIYGLDGALAEHRSRSCSAPGDVPPPTEWPMLNPSPQGTVTSVQNGDVSCYILLSHADGSETNHNASYDLCDDSVIGKTVRLEMGLGTVMGPTCEGDPECADQIEIALATGVQVVEAP